MGEHQYLAHHSLPHPDSITKTPGFSDGARSPDPRCSAYPELVYSAATSFNYPASCDSSLLTPTSSSGSPQLHHLSRKAAHQYPAPGTPPQEHTPSDTSGSNMYQGWGQYTASSPMHTPATVAPEYTTSYSHEGRRTPAPPEPYLGNFGVSTGGENPSVEGSYYMNVPAVGTGLMSGQSLPIPGSQAAVPSAPILSTHHNSMPRRVSLEDHMLPLPQDIRGSLSAVRRAAPPRSTRNKRSAGRRSSGSRNSPQTVDPSRDHTNCFGETVPPKLKSSCNEIDRQVFECRWKHREQLGQHMWSLIQKEMTEKTGKEFGREDLQMKFRRARAHIQWLPQDEEKLFEAWQMVEKDRYKRVLSTFHSLGGSANMCLNPVDIEAKIVEMKLEDGIYIQGPRDGLGVRRRMKVSARKRVGEHQPDEDMKYLLAEHRDNTRIDSSMPYIKEEILSYRGTGIEDHYENMLMNGSGRMSHGM